MNREEAAALLTVVASYDRRTLGEADVIAWHKALEDMPFEPCRDAVVKHYATATDWVMPAHLRRLATAARQDTAMRTLPSSTDELIEKPEWFDTTAAHYRERLRAENAERVARGERRVFGETVKRPSDGRPGW